MFLCSLFSYLRVLLTMKTSKGRSVLKQINQACPKGLKQVGDIQCYALLHSFFTLMCNVTAQHIHTYSQFNHCFNSSSQMILIADVGLPFRCFFNFICCVIILTVVELVINLKKNAEVYCVRGQQPVLSLSWHPYLLKVFLNNFSITCFKSFIHTQVVEALFVFQLVLFCALL